MSVELDLQDEWIKAKAHATTDMVARDTLRPAALGIGLYYALLSISYLLRFSPGIAVPMALAGFGTTAVFLVIRKLAEREQFSSAWAHPIGAAMASMVLADIVIQHWAIKPGQFTNFALLLVGSGFLILDSRWLALIFAATIAAWAMTAHALYPSVTTGDFAVQFVATFTVASVVHVARVRTLRRFEDLRLQDQVRKTELETAVEALQYSEERFRKLSNATFEGIVFHDRGRVLDANETLLKMFGYEYQDVTGKSVMDFVAPESRAMIARRVIVHDDSPCEAFGLKHDGTRFPLEVRGKDAHYQGAEVRVVALRDITQRRLAEEALHEEHQRYQALFDRTNDAVFIIGLNNLYLAVNQRAADLLGCAVEEIIGKRVEDFTVPEESDDVESRRTTLLTGEVMPVYERTFRRKDGTTFAGEVNAALVSDSEGKPLHIHSVVRDVTERKRIEAEREQIIQELQTFAHTVAHDLKNPLGLVLAYASLLRDDAGSMPVEVLRDYGDKIVEGANKMRTIIEELLLLAQTRYGEIQSVPLDMGPLVASVCRRLAATCAEVQAEIILPDPWPLAMGYGPWIEEVWFNYLSNALKYGGRPPRIQLGADVQEDGHVRYWMRDSGPGLTPEEVTQLFVPFTQLEQVNSRGHGLGLSIVRHIVEKLGGQVGVESGVGQGSLFYFTLPAAVATGTAVPGQTGV